MSKVSLLKYHSTNFYSHNISNIIAVSKNKEQLNQLANRLSRFSSEEVLKWLHQLTLIFLMERWQLY